MTPAPARSIEIAVLGAGPAGASVAIGLSRLGYQVSVFHVPRNFAATEGVSARTLAALHSAGLPTAAAVAGAPLPRQVIWNGDISSANQEASLERSVFDTALLEDLREAGVDCVQGRVRSLHDDASSVVIDVAGVSSAERRYRAAFVIDARGRGSPRSGAGRVRGPEAVSLCRRFYGPGLAPGIWVESAANGWLWVQSDGARAYAQLCLDANSVALEASTLEGSFERLLRAFSLAAPLADLSADAVFTRSSTVVLREDLVAGRRLRVGDAAMAVDPLSGNGIFQSLSSASVAPSVVNTLLKQPDARSLAEAFYTARVGHLFSRFARLGRDFYRMESRYADEPFWRARQQWPDNEPAHSDDGSWRLSRRPVVAGGYIAEADVVVTADQPLGVWRVADVELAPLIREGLLAQLHAGQAEQWLEARGVASAPQRADVIRWIRTQLGSAPDLGEYFG